MHLQTHTYTHTLAKIRLKLQFSKRVFSEPCKFMPHCCTRSRPLCSPISTTQNKPFGQRGNVKTAFENTGHEDERKDKMRPTAQYTEHISNAPQEAAALSCDGHTTSASFHGKAAHAMATTIFQWETILPGSLHTGTIGHTY